MRWVRRRLCFCRAWFQNNGYHRDIRRRHFGADRIALGERCNPFWIGMGWRLDRRKHLCRWFDGRSYPLDNRRCCCIESRLRILRRSTQQGRTKATKATNSRDFFAFHILQIGLTSNDRADRTRKTNRTKPLKMRCFCALVKARGSSYRVVLQNGCNVEEKREDRSRGAVYRACWANKRGLAGASDACAAFGLAECFLCAASGVIVVSHL